MADLIARSLCFALGAGSMFGFMQTTYLYRNSPYRRAYYVMDGVAAALAVAAVVFAQ